VRVAKIDPSGLIKTTVEGLFQCWSSPTITGFLVSTVAVGLVAGLFVGEAECVSVFWTPAED
jgi:hypothetical protein